MATYAELVADVGTLTNRPDLSAEIAIAVKAATLKLHHKDFFFKDLYETGIQFDSAAYLQTIAYRTLFPTYRAIKYLRKLADPTDPDENAPFYKLITTEQVLDKYALTQTDTYYVAGTVIQIKSSTLDTYALMGVYIDPVVTPTGYNSWIALEQPYAIVFEATANICNNVLKDKVAGAKWAAMAAEEYDTLMRHNIVANGE